MDPIIPFLVKELDKLSKYKKYLFDEYNYYYDERKKIKKEIIYSLNNSTTSYSFKTWFRLINTKYSSHPLSCRGSVEHPTGGRFNIGKIDCGRFPVFPALYIGNTKETCVKEIYDGMREFLDTKTGDSFFSVSGYIHSLLNITTKNSLNNFIKTIKQITLSKSLQDRYKTLGVGKREVLQNITQFKKNIYHRNWRLEPNIYDIPSFSQVFGQLVREAGIEAMLYKSIKKSREGFCIVIFPENFKNSDSYIRLNNAPGNIIHKQMDSKTFCNFY